MAKRAIERFSEGHCVHIQPYHCDNGCFADNAFVTDCKQNKQHITYCGVNAHFQNGMFERAIWEIHKQAQKQLLHARAR